MQCGISIAIYEVDQIQVRGSGQEFFEFLYLALRYHPEEISLLVREAVLAVCESLKFQQRTCVFLSYYGLTRSIAIQLFASEFGRISLLCYTPTSLADHLLLDFK